MAKLVINGTPHELLEEVISVGRAPDNLIQIDDPSVSSRHAELRLTDDVYELCDLGSTNGTRLNGASVKEARLRHGDRVRFGKAEARFEGDASDASAPLPEAEAIEAKPADFSARPVDFKNASPFPGRRKEKDPTRTAIFAAAIAAVVVFLASMVAVLTMRAPMP